ncbi:hypothetical protein R1flu_001196 [Riccia fluitans]|uniref:Myb/SANT-like DNA-binding domain-containing protein n=1 Tax=Riccia fluitans TaxID=41844 RepID=A0ABD1Y2L5_9MARC
MSGTVAFHLFNMLEMEHLSSTIRTVADKAFLTLHIQGSNELRAGKLLSIDTLVAVACSVGLAAIAVGIHVSGAGRHFDGDGVYNLRSFGVVGFGSDPIPGRDEPLPITSLEDITTEEDARDPGSDEESAHEDVAEINPEDIDDEGNNDQRTYWRDHEVVALIEAHREFSEFCQQLKDRKKKLLSTDDKWMWIVESMRVKGVEKSLKQMKGKWKTLLQEFCKIRNHDNKSGEAPYNFDGEGYT